MKKSIQTASRLLCVGLGCLAVLMADAREPTSFPVQRLDDSRLVPFFSGVPRKEIDPTPVCGTGYVLSGGSCVALNTGAGATLLPYEMPAGAYTNNASYPLLLTITPPEICYNFGVYVRGELAAWVKDDCEASRTTVSVLVPPYSGFSIGGGLTRVTAFKSGASWAETGVGFYYSTQFSRITYTDYGRDASNCSYDLATYLWTHNLYGSQYTTSAIENQYCPV